MYNCMSIFINLSWKRYGFTKTFLSTIQDENTGGFKTTQWYISLKGDNTPKITKV